TTTAFSPCYAVITEGKQHEIGVARQLRYEPGTLLAIDRGYLDYGWFADLSEQGVYFVTRMKDNADYLVVQDRVLVFVTNRLTLAAATVAEVYKQRWQIELFFKALKQNLRVKTFIGTS